MTKETKDTAKKGLMDKLAERDVEVEREVAPETQRDIFNIDELLTELDEVGTSKYLDIPQAVTDRFKEQGVQLAWIRIRLNGVDDVDNIKRKLSSGWRLLPAHAVPELSGLGVEKMGFLKELDKDREVDYIVRKDVALAANYATNVAKSKAHSTQQADLMQHSLKGKVKGQGLTVDKETGIEVKTGKNAIFG